MRSLTIRLCIALDLEHVEYRPLADLDDGKSGSLSLGELDAVPHYLSFEYFLVEGIEPRGVVGDHGHVIQALEQHGESSREFGVVSSVDGWWVAERACDHRQCQSGCAKWWSGLLVADWPTAGVRSCAPPDERPDPVLRWSDAHDPTNSVRTRTEYPTDRVGGSGSSDSILRFRDLLSAWWR
jgi:hypothetical protein